MNLAKFLSQEEELKQTLGEVIFNDLKKTITESIKKNNIQHRRMLMIDLFDYIVKSIEIENVNLD